MLTVFIRVFHFLIFWAVGFSTEGNLSTYQCINNVLPHLNSSQEYGSGK